MKMTAWQPLMLCYKLTGDEKTGGPDVELMRSCASAEYVAEQYSFAKVRYCVDEYLMQKGS